MRHAQSVAKQGAQEERRGWAPPVGTYNELERVVNAGCQVTSRPQPWDVPLKEFGELHCTSSPRSLAAARNDEGPRFYMSSREAVRSLRHATDVHKPSGRVPHVFLPPPPCRVFQSQSAVRALLMFPLSPSLLHVGFRRGSWPPPPPKSPTATILPAVSVDVHPTLWRHHIFGVSSVVSRCGATFFGGAAHHFL